MVFDNAEISRLVKEQAVGSQASLARFLGVSQSFMSQVMAGKKPWPSKLALKVLSANAGLIASGEGVQKDANPF